MQTTNTENNRPHKLTGESQSRKPTVPFNRVPGDRLPVLKNAYTRFRRKLVSGIRRLFPSYYYRRMEPAIELRTHWVKPSEIPFAMNRHPQIDNIHEVILGGEWDRSAVPLESLKVFQAFNEVMREGKSWFATEFYRDIVNRIHSGECLWECATEEAFRERVFGLEALYNEIRTGNYIPNNNRDEITVAIGRDGQLIHYDGRHRLIIAKLLEIDSVPIRIVARHLDWVRFKNEIFQFVRSQDGKVYAPLLHPDLEWIPSFYGHKRFEMIQRATNVRQGTLLDIGCNWGYFCHRFEQAGFECTGVEFDSYCAYFLNKLKRASNRHFAVHNQSVFDYFEQGNKAEFDVVLALAIFHHFIKTEEGCNRLSAMLKRIRTREMYFIPHKESETQMQEAYWNPSADEFAQFISSNTGLRRVTCLGNIEDGRRIFRLTRE